MSFHGTNTFIPFPRYENAVFIGDTAAETLAELKIYARGLIGGELPNMQSYHPAEKLLECTSCVMNDQRLLPTAMRRGEIDDLLLENNSVSDMNLKELAPRLEASGFCVKILDITEDPVENIKRAAFLFQEEKRGERVVREYLRTEEALRKLPPLPMQKILSLLAIRYPVDDRIFLFAISGVSELNREIYPALNAINPVREDLYDTVIPGLVEVNDLAPFLSYEPDWIAVMGDALGVQKKLSEYVQSHPREVPKALSQMKVFSVPYYARPLAVRKPSILKFWREAAEKTND